MIEELDDYTNNTVFCPVIKNCIPVINPNENVVSVECFDSIDRLLYFKKQDQIFKSIEKRKRVYDYQLDFRGDYTGGNRNFGLCAG